MALIPGRGNPNAMYMIVGEAPGAEEERQGRPFVGASGRLVQEQIERLGIEDDVWITNVVKERPPDNRTPTDEEVKLWLPYLVGEIYTIYPEVIIALGKVAMNTLIGRSSMRANHGRWCESIYGDDYNPPQVFSLYHPAYVLYGGISRDEYARAWNKLVGL